MISHIDIGCRNTKRMKTNIDLMQSLKDNDSCVYADICSINAVLDVSSFLNFLSLSTTN